MNSITQTIANPCPLDQEENLNKTYKTKWIEPAPNRFYCPEELYLAWSSEPNGFPGEWLGSSFKSPGGAYTYEVQSGPCCRLFYGNGYAETHSFERGWKPKDELAYMKDPIGYGAIGTNWTRVGANYLSYAFILKSSLNKEVSLDTISYVTVRWEAPLSKDVPVAKVCTLVCPLIKPLDILNKNAEDSVAA